MTKYLSLCVNIRNVYLMNRKRTTEKRTDLDAPITCPFHSLRSGTERIYVWKKLRLCTDYVLSKWIGVICHCTYLIKVSKVALLSLAYVPSSTAWWKEHQGQRWSFQPPPQGSSFSTYVPRLHLVILTSYRNGIIVSFSNLTWLVDLTGCQAAEGSYNSGISFKIF